VYPWPSFATIALPLLSLLGNVQAQVDSDEDAGARDAEVLAQQDRAKEAKSQKTMEEIKAHFTLAKTLAAVEEIGKTITPALTRSMLTAHVGEPSCELRLPGCRGRNATAGNRASRRVATTPSRGLHFTRRSRQQGTNFPGPDKPLAHPAVCRSLRLRAQLLSR
jgi:hypothetical protein